MRALIKTFLTLRSRRGPCRGAKLEALEKAAADRSRQERLDASREKRKKAAKELEAKRQLEALEVTRTEDSQKQALSVSGVSYRKCSSRKSLNFN